MSARSPQQPAALVTIETAKGLIQDSKTNILAQKRPSQANSLTLTTRDQAAALAKRRRQAVW
jgi:hypothetical protein